MATKRQKTEVGIFLATAVALLTVVLLVLSGVRRKHLDSYHLEFEENIAGLTEGSKVTYRGVPVGKILDLVVTPENRVGITVGIDPMKVRLREGVRGRYSMVSIFGPYVVDLSGGGDSSAPLLPPGSAIPVQTSLLAGLEETVAETVPFTLQRANKLMARLEGLLSKVKPEDIPAILRQAEQAVASANKAIEDFRQRMNAIASSLDKAIASTRAEAEKLSGKTAASLEKFQQASDKAAKLIDTLQAALDENRKPLAESLKRLDAALTKVNKELEGLELAATSASVRKAADKMAQAADSFTTTTQGLGTAAKTVSRSREDVRSTLENIQRSITSTFAELDRTLRSARDLLDTLERDPSAILRGKRD